MTQERKGSVVMQGTLRDILTVIEKKIRNLEKRKTRLEQVEKDVEMGKEVSENQRSALSKKDQVSDMLEVCRDFLQTAEQLAKNEEAVARTRAKKEQREANQRTIDTLGKVMRLQFLLGEALRREESDDDNRALEALRQSVDEASAKDFGKVAELWLNVLEAKPKEFVAGVTFEAVHAKLSSMGELLAKLDEVSLCTDGLENSGKNEGFGPLTNIRGDSPLNPDAVISDMESTTGGIVETQPSEEPPSMHNVGSAGDQHQQLPLEQTDSFSTVTAPSMQQLQQQIHDQQMASTHHAVSPVPAVHHHPAAILLKGKKGGEDMFCTVAFYSHAPIDDYRYLLPPRELVPPIPQVINHQSAHPAPHPGVHHGTSHGHHPSHGGLMAVIPGMNVVPVSPVQEQQSQSLKEENNGDTIQFGSVENALTVQSQQHHIQPPHHINGTPCCATEPSPAVTVPDLDSMFEDREFDFFQDDQLPSTFSNASPCSALVRVPSSLARYYDHMHPSSKGSQSLTVDKNLPIEKQREIYEDCKRMEENLFMLRQKFAQGLKNTRSDDTQQQNGTTEGQKVDATNEIRIAEQHPQHGYNARDNRRSPRDNNSRGDHHDQSQQQPVHKGSSNNIGYYRGASAGGSRGNRSGHKGGHYADSSGRNNWSDNRRGGDNSSNSRGNSSWNGRNDRAGYTNGPRHHGGNNGGGYGNRNGGMMTRRA
ncbi:caprin homolog isoform X2 [Varroa destructor]|nr:caprin homolog isoform X2 [Varroa destructor]